MYTSTWVSYPTQDSPLSPGSVCLEGQPSFSQTEVQTSKAFTPQGSLPAPISDTLSMLLLWHWPCSWKVTLGLMQFNHFPTSPDLQQVITRRQINNHKWTVQMAGWWVPWHFKHLFDSKEWKPGWMQNNRAHCLSRGLSLTAPFINQRKHLTLLKGEGKRISGVVSSLDITWDLNRNCNYLYTNFSWRKHSR